MNMLQDVRPGHLGPFTWAHEPARWEPLPEGGLRIVAPAHADYFRDPGGATLRDAAPYLWLPVTGDFVARARVRPHFRSTYDSGSILVRQDASRWAKICYESTDFGTQAVVSVVTNGSSDDANGPNLTAPDVWLQVARVGTRLGLHYALDGEHWQMVRYVGLNLPPTVQVGLVAQCPAGEEATIDWLAFDLEARTVANLRAGV